MKIKFTYLKFYLLKEEFVLVIARIHAQYTYIQNPVLIIITIKNRKAKR